MVGPGFGYQFEAAFRGKHIPGFAEGDGFALAWRVVWCGCLVRLFHPWGGDRPAPKDRAEWPVK